MEGRNFYLVVSITLMFIFAIIGFILGKYIIKTNDRKVRILILICIGIIGTVILYIMSYSMNLNLAQEVIIRGFCGMPLGFGISTPRKNIKI
jgi:MFS-type transporter involved in bile tolerance (Atg22 family)